MLSTTAGTLLVPDCTLNMQCTVRTHSQYLVCFKQILCASVIKIQLSNYLSPQQADVRPAEVARLYSYLLNTQSLRFWNLEKPTNLSMLSKRRRQSAPLSCRQCQLELCSTACRLKAATPSTQRYTNITCCPSSNHQLLSKCVFT